MKDCFITFRSVTFAQRGESELKRGGIPCNVQRTPRWMEEQGCGYSLRVRFLELEDVVALLKNHRISYRKVYLEGDNGAMEELTL